MNAKLRVLSGHLVEQTIEVHHGKFLIGRADDCQLQCESPFLSRHHCVVLLDEFTLRIRDLGSKNGTFVNGRRIGSGEGVGETILVDGDAVRTGEISLEIALDCSTRGGRAALSDEVPTNNTFNDDSAPAVSRGISELTPCRASRS
jgi:pSer/pThr/pTyr-binding forkhead associated (FHA) protein